MASTISANSAGGGGLVSSGDASGVLALQTAGVTALSIDASQKVTFANSLTSPTLVTPTLVTPNINSAQVPTISGTAPLYMCRAWVNFNGTGTVAIRASGNVSSITDNGVGDYTVNFTTAMADADYSAIANCNGVSGSSITPHIFGSGQGIAAYTASSVRMQLEAGGVSPADREVVTVAIFR